MELKGKKIAILATNGFEQSELETPLARLKSAGAAVEIISLAAGEIKGWDKKDWGRAVKVDKTLDLMTSVFGITDSLLRQVGMITLYFYLYRQVVYKKVTRVDRQMLARFERDRDENREVVEATGETGKKVDTALLEFDKHSQTPNDAYAIRIRLRILLRYLQKNFNVKYDESIVLPAE